jgi:ADP-heptose:LPS heptosyltransferase
MLATPVLAALRRAYPDAHITWAIGRWSRAAIEDHNLLDDVLDTGGAALPVYGWRDFWRFVRLMHNGRYDLAVSLVRSPLMSVALLLSGIRLRAGVNSGGRGFGYNLRADIDPDEARHEAEIYLDVVRKLGLDTAGCYANVPVSNPGMEMDSKRWPPGHFAALIERLRESYGVSSVLLAGPKDQTLINVVESHLKTPVMAFSGLLSFPQIAALAAGAMIYIGNDTGLTHLAAGTGVKTVMIFGPSDPARYAPFTPNSRAVWKPTTLKAGGVASGTPDDWDWARDGIGVDEVYNTVTQFLDEG